MPAENESRDNKYPDHAGVAFHPPIMLLVFLLVGFGLRALLPFAFVPGEFATPCGVVVVVLALALFFWAVVTMLQSGASIPTNEPTMAIVSSGPYQYTRNPIYLAMIILLVGIAIWANSLWFLGFSILALLLLSWGVISREEAYLARKFGSEYESYKFRVRRWL